MSTLMVKWLMLLIVACCAGVPAGAHSIRHIVVLMEENRSFDHLLGFAHSLKINGLTGKERNPVSTLTPNSPWITVDKDAHLIASCDPDHATYATTVKIFGERNLLVKNYTEEMIGFVEWENFKRKGNGAAAGYCKVMSMFDSEKKLPVLTTLAREYAVMDRFFASVPGCTWPNRQFAMAATSGGNTETYFWYKGKPGNLYPQKTIFDQLAEEGLTWANYYADTPWELMMQGVAHNPENIQTMDTFFAAAAAGELPSYSFINPRTGVNLTSGVGSNDMHPDHDIAEGEMLYKSIYESLRASPAWNDTLFIITFDEHGGFFDHVAPPSEGVPAPDDEKAFPDWYFKFNRLGLRIPTVLISPWIPRGTVISAPPAAQKPQNSSEYDLTSIMATVRKIFNMSSPPLTRRDAWAATFEHALSLRAPRSDCKVHLPPTAPQSPARLRQEGDQGLNGLQRSIMTMLEQLTEGGSGHPHPVLDPLGARWKGTVQTQKEVGEWAAARLAHHKVRTAQWKSAQTKYRVVVSATVEVDWIFGDLTWDVNSNASYPFVTLSTRTLKSSPGNVPYCLSHSGGSSFLDPTVALSLCYPAPAPMLNRDPRQHWLYGGDATIRPFSNSTLCLTTAYNYGDSTVYILPCNNSVTQHWGYMGSAPGMHNDGEIFFGNGIASLGVVVVW